MRAVRGGVAVCTAVLLAATLVAERRHPGAHAQASAAPGRQPAPGWAAAIGELSEPGGYFDTDNLISNERSYAEPMPALDAAGLAGGVYIGVGPDQNFSYIARLKPSAAYLIDIRRDNLLLHLLFKAFFELADTRAEYLCLLIGCAVPPADLARTREMPAGALADWTDMARRHRPIGSVPDPRIDRVLAAFGVPLSAGDRDAVTRFHRSFQDEGLDLKFHSFGRPPQRHYPSYRDLMTETDPAGAPAHFLATEAAYAVVRDLQRRDAIVPLVGDLAGPTALAALGRRLESSGARVSAVYVSNVEYYLFGTGRFRAFAAHLARLPRRPGAVLLRSVFQGMSGPVRPGYGSTSVAVPVDAVVRAWNAGAIDSYGDLLRVVR
ncbi:MAG: hypothetical protein AB7I25_04040 [Vicinamibacterales bacterium]